MAEDLTVAESRVARGSDSSASPAEALTTTFREIISAPRQTTGHAYIGFRCQAVRDAVASHSAAWTPGDPAIAGGIGEALLRLCATGWEVSASSVPQPDRPSLCTLS